MCGPPGSGKSTLCKTKFPTVPVVSTDNLILAYAESIGSSYSEVFKEYFPEAERVFKAQLVLLQEQGKPFIIDRTNMTVKSRMKTIRLIYPEYFITAISFPIIAPDILVERVSNRTNQPLSANLVRSMADMYVRPTYDEPFDLILNVENFNDT